MRYHKVNIILNSVEVLPNRTILNSSFLVLNTDEKLDVNEISSILKIQCIDVEQEDIIDPIAFA